jgi:PEP-CTERM motif
MQTGARFGVVLVAALLSGWGQARSEVIIGNIPPTYTSPTYNTNGQIPFSSLGNNYGIEFVATANETVTQALLVLTLPVGSTPTLGIYDSALPSPASLVGPLSLTGPTTGTAITETFTGSVPLTAGSDYFLILSLPSGSGPFNWSSTFTAANLSGLTPVGPGAAFVAAGGTSSGGSYASTNMKTSFELDGVADPPPPPPTVPEPSSLALLSLGGLALAGWRRWKKRARA